MNRRWRRKQRRRKQNEHMKRGRRAKRKMKPPSLGTGPERFDRLLSQLADKLCNLRKLLPPGI
jgi:hypothetical protein